MEILNEVMINDKQKLIAAINRRIESLDPEDAESHIWYEKFLKLIEELL